MGLLTDFGNILDPQQTNKLQIFLKKLGIKQFLNVFKKYQHWQKNTNTHAIKWGQQIQGHFLHFNTNKYLQLCFEPLGQEYKGVNFPLVLQYGRWMFEMTPLQPYSSQCDFRQIIQNLQHQYKVLQSKSRIALTIPNIPFLGYPPLKNDKEFDNKITKSIYIDDKHIADHMRYRALTKNIIARRGSTVEINAPIYIDKNTSKQQLSKTQKNPNFINMDAMAFGMGMACLQCTFSTKNLDHARYLYDQMHILSPLMLAVTAGTPFFKGKIANWDVRWKVLEASVDCRNEKERDEKSQSYIPNSRYSPADLFIWNNAEYFRPEYNDFDINFQSAIKAQIAEQAKLKNIEIDQHLLNHIANLFKRDHLIVYQKFKELSEENVTLFELLNGTNWNSVRLKIPIDDEIGWRVEFRTMQVQLTAHENAAYSLLIHFFTRALHLDKIINLYIPMSLVKINFDRAHTINGVLKQKFYFRTNIFDNGQPIIKQLTIYQIFFGNQSFIGIFNYVKDALFSQCGKCQKTEKFKDIIKRVGQHLRDITLGKKMTLAQWMRNYVDRHPDYTHNSILPKRTMDDMLLTLYEISKGQKVDMNFTRIF